MIRLADFSNTSRVVTFFTRDFGKISTIAKGGKRLKGPFDTGLDLLSESDLVFLRKSGTALDILTEARLKHRFRPNSANIGSFYAGCYVADLLNTGSHRIQDHEHQLMAMLNKLDSKERKKNYLMILTTPPPRCRQC